MSTNLKYASRFGLQRLAPIVVTGLMASFQAGAAIETLPVVSYPLTQTDYSVGLQVAQFDSSLGQLQSITITAAGTALFNQFYQNLSTSSADLFTISQHLDLILSLPAGGIGSILDLNLNSGNQIYAAQKYVSGSPFFSGPSGGTANYTVADSSSSTLTSASSSFSQFTGSGSINFLLTANSSSMVMETNGNYSAGAQTLAGLDLTVAYNYIPSVSAPEPSTWAWMAGVVALAGLFIGHGKRQSKTP